MRNLQLITLLAIFLSACTANKIKVDAILHNGTFITVANDTTYTGYAVAVKDGKIVQLAPEKTILGRYEAPLVKDLKGAFVYPGFNDGHSHFYGLGAFMNQADLTGTKSFEEVLQRLEQHSKKSKGSWLLGRGWDQNDWEVKEFPDREALDKLFPNTPVLLKRVDGHAALANGKALEIAGITPQTKTTGGQAEVKNGRLTGILIDNAVDLVTQKMPQPTDEELKNYLLTAQKICFENGLTTVTDAGLDKDVIFKIKKLQDAGDLSIRLYVMANGDDKNIDYFSKNGKIKTPLLHVCAFKVYGDGALGSRGACLLHPYSDMPGHYGTLLSSPERLAELAEKIAKTDFQMCTHCIGDSANAYMLEMYGKYIGYANNRRWRIEHAQVVDWSDVMAFERYNIIPSMQPTHATSDMYWAEKRLGPERIKTAYSLLDLKSRGGIIVLGTDFPVEAVSPIATFYAAIARKDAKGYPEGGFNMENALPRKDALKGMTIWAAYGAFEENEKGTIETGKYADFTILDRNIMTCPETEILKTRILGTWVGGNEVYTAKE